MYFKRFFLSILLLSVMQMTWAVIAYPGLVDFRQPDGSVVRLKLKGDEYFHWAESEDGYTLLADDEGFMTLAIPDKQGDLRPSRYKAANILQRSPEFLNAMKQVKPGAEFSRKQLEEPLVTKMLAASRNEVIVSDQPVVGKRKFLVILMEFADVKFKTSAEGFYRLLNEERYNLDGNSGSVHDFYMENSFGQLDLHCDVAGVYRASQTMAFYGGNSHGNPAALAIEALQAASRDYNLADYDSNGDGFIDGVHIIFAGYGEEAGGGEDCIWSHESTTTGTFCIVDGIRMNMYSCTPELRGGSGNNMSRIGVICHEIGHALGTMDYYDTNYGTGGNYPGTGQWDVMGSGNWNNDGGSPAHFNPYSKIYDFKWSEVQDGNKPQMITLSEKTKGAFVRIDTHTDGEFFILEYRNKTSFDASIPGHGLMVWRSSEYMSRYQDNTINAFHRQQFYPLCANATARIPTNDPNSYGNLNSASTPFPGTLGKTSLTDETTPSMRNWNGDPTGLPVTEIVENVSGGSVSFMIAGGDGQAYGLNVRQVGFDFITLGWENDAHRKVMLVCNTTATFGIPNSTDYSVGAEIAGGGTVIYVGYDTSFTHENLEEGTEYYYQLFTKQENGSGWSSPIEQRGQTDIRYIKKYPYFEDFENGVLPTGWSQELIYGTNFWTVQKEWELTSYVLYFNWAFDMGQRQGAKAIMPSFNFDGHENALLEFDYRNLLIDMRVIYRSSPDEDWKDLIVLNNHYKTGGMMSNYDAYASEEHAVIPLPDLSDEYQIAFVSDFEWRGNIKSSTEVGTIDNIKVSVDYSPFALTNNPVSVTGTSAEIMCTVLPGNETVREMGIEWSIDQSDWTQVSASRNGGIVTLSGLPKATRIYYRSYLVTTEGRYEGAILSFETMDGGNGSGTENDPFIIASSKDWEGMTALVKGGNDLSNVYYALSSSFDYIPNSTTWGTFNGHLDGRGYTITMKVNNGYSMFESIAENGVVENLNFVCGSYTANDHFNALLVLNNSGLITNCNVRIESMYLKGTRNSAGICNKNFGTISYCNSYIYLPKNQLHYDDWCSPEPSQAEVGGICWYNSALIDHCSFNGEMYANNNSKLGGIASNNWYEDDEVRGHITNCINYGKLSIFLIDGKSWAAEIGGIAGTNYGTIDYCINEGKITGECNSSDAMIGGISAWNCQNSVMRHCLNRGTVEMNAYDMSAPAGGVTGFNDSALTEHCANDGPVIVIGSRSANTNAVIGRHRTDKTNNNYYSSEMDDRMAVKVTSWESAINSFNDAAGMEVWQLIEGRPGLIWETGGDLNWIKINRITRFTSTSISGSYACSGSIGKCGVEYRKLGDTEWSVINYTPDANGVSFTISGLAPMTEYEVRAYMVLKDGHSNHTSSQTIMTDFPESATVVEISSENDLKVLARVTSQGHTMDAKVVRLTADIDMGASKSRPWRDIIGTFNGEFDGDGHYIYNLKLVSDADHFGEGLFSDGSSYIHDLHFYDVDIDISRYEGEVFYVGAIVGICKRIERCSVIGKMKFSCSGSNLTWSSVGGVAGCAQELVKDCYALLTFDSDWTTNFGGVVGRGQAYNCYYGIISTQVVNTKPIGILGNLNRLGSDPAATADYCYFYEKAMADKYINGTPLSWTQMNDGTLLAKLNSVSAGIWASGVDGKKLDFGFPVLAGQRAFPYELEMDPDFEEPEEDKPGSTSDFTYRTSGKTAIITGLSNTFNKQSIDVPKELEIDGKTYPVVEIAGYAFAYRYGITSISLHEGLKTIGEEAFNELNNVTSLIIPASVDSICGSYTTHLGAMAALKEISVAKGNGKYCTVDGVLFTKDMKTLVKYPAAKAVHEYVIPDGITSIFSQAFRRCQAKAIVIPESVTKISYLSFDDGDALNRITCKAMVPPEIIADYPDAGLSCLYDYDLYVSYKAIDMYRQSTIWSAAKSINEIPHTLGDVNDDELVDIADAVCIVNDRLGYESTGFIRHWSDINNDGQYTIADAVADINIMYDKPVVSGVIAKVIATGREKLVLYQSDANSLSLDLNCSQAYSAFQFDMSLPEEISLENIVLNEERVKGFTVQFHQTDNCHYKVVAVNYENEAIVSGIGNLLSFNILGLGDMDAIAISDIHFSDIKATDVKFEDIRLSDYTTGVGVAEDTDSNRNVYYNLSGQRIDGPTDGIYIMNGVKIVNQ